MYRVRLTITVVALMVLAVSLSGQEISASLSGVVTDPSGAAVVGATVTAVSLDTGFSQNATSGVTGGYLFPRLPASNYRLTVDATGFRQYVRQPITLRAGDKSNVAVTLQIGAASESVTVTAELTGIEGSESVMGQVMDSRKISDLPTNGRNFIMLLQTTSGVIFTPSSFGAGGSWTMPNQFAVLSDGFTMHGGRNGTNAYILDGGVSSQGAPYVPPPEAIEDMKVSSPTSDASQGLSGGGVVSVTMKSGSNSFHGAAVHALRNAVLTANQIQTNLSLASRPWSSTQYQYNNMTYMLSGPIIKNKLFISANYDGVRMRTADTQTVTVPTELQKAGDFSQTFNAQGQLILINDPKTTTLQGGRYVRTPYAGNVIPASSMTPLSKALTQMLPVENLFINPVTHYQNYTNAAGLQQDHNSEFVKVDYLWNERHRTSGSESISQGDSSRDVYGWAKGSPFRGSSGDPLRRANKQVTVDHVWSMNATTILDVRFSMDRFYEMLLLTSKTNWVDSDPKAGQLAALWKGIHGSNPDPKGTPGVGISGYVTMGSGLGSWMNTRQPATLVADLSRTVNRHLLRFGTRYTVDTRNNPSHGNWDGLFSFTGGFTQSDPQRSDTTSGNGFADFLLGYPGSGSTDITAPTSRQYKNFALYAQDDFRVNAKLMLNFGLRWDVQTAATEKWDRVMTGFDPNVQYYLGDPNGSNQSPNAKGGVIWANKAGQGGSTTRQAWPTTWRDFQPRAGVAYQISRRLLVRGGYGISFLPNGSGNINTCCFDRTTNMVVTQGGDADQFIPGLPGTGTFENPFPTGLLQPYGASQGPKTRVGNSVSYTNQGRVNPRIHQFNVGLSSELPGKITAEASYVGGRTRRMDVSLSQNAISLNDRLAAIADPTYLSGSVSNPFYGAPELAGTSMAAASITKQQSLLPYPQFTGVTQSGNNFGFSSYNGLEVRVIKRLSHGLTVNGVYTLAKVISVTGLLNDQAPYNTPMKQLDSLDRTHHVVVTVLYDLPLGRGRAVGTNWPRALDLIAGHWQTNVIWEKPTGTPLSMPQTPVSDPRMPEGQQTDAKYFKTCTLLSNGTRANCASPEEPIVWVQPKPNEFRTSSSVFPNLRAPWRASLNASMMKEFPIREQLRLNFRMEAFNATNCRIYSPPSTSLTSLNFGQVSHASQTNFAREIQFVLRLTF